MAADATPTGLLGLVTSTPTPPEEIRFGVILNGGVSLAVWMGGAVLEVDRVTRASRQPSDEPIYAAMLALAGCQARADVIAGTSAGGINGAALALSQVNELADLRELRDIWSEQGRIESLLRQPFKGSPTSLLQGDEYFLPSLNNALGRLATPRSIRPRDEAPVDLTITTTVLNGNQSITIDSLGQRLPQSLHAGRFRWQRHADPLCTHGRSPDDCPTCDPFSYDSIERTAHRLALASRCTASFPVAFEPVFVPVGSPLHADPPGSVLTDEQRLRPDMAGFVDQWGDENAGDRSRFVVDGGVLANTPTRAALEAVQAMPASGPVRRIMLLVYPHAGHPGANAPDESDRPPTLLDSMTGLLGALTAQGSRTFVDELEDHNRFAASRRGVRSNILAQEASAEELHQLAHELYPHYQHLRRSRASRDFAERSIGNFRPGEHAGRLADTWSYERVRAAAARAGDAWTERRAVDPTRPSLPFVPDELPTHPLDLPAGWAWGVTTAIGIADAAADFLRQLVWVLGHAPNAASVTEARRTVSALSTQIRAERRSIDAMWAEHPLLTPLEPNHTYWELRLASYERLMLGWGAAPQGPEAEFRALASAALESWRGSGPMPTADQLVQAISTEPPGVVGRRVRRLVNQVAEEMLQAVPLLEDRAGATRLRALGSQVDELARWRKVILGPTTPRRAELVVRLLHLEVANTSLGEEARTGTDIPVEIVQVSAHTQNASARYTRSADDKLGGWSLNRFGGFVKRSWRVNDWTWGRIDAATILSQTILQPARIRRVAVLSGAVLAPAHEESTDEESTDEGAAGWRATLKDHAVDLAERTVAELMSTVLFPGYGHGDLQRLTSLRAEAVAELAVVFDTTRPIGDLPPALPHLAGLFAWALHLDIVPGELPALASAIRSDRVDGANPRSRGETFLEEQQDLLVRLSSPGVRPTPGDAVMALEAFDRAGIGREPWNEEISSDLVIRSAVTAAAVAATVMDSDRSGLRATKPVTRAMRGGMLLPYWAVIGLSSRSVLPRTLALLALSLGGAVLTLALLGVLPESLSGPGTAVGVSAVLVAFAYGAMRSGTLLHGLMLLTPVVPLVAWAVSRLSLDADATQQGLGTIVVVLLLSLGLIVLGSIPAASGTVWATLDRLADRQGAPPVSRSAEGAGRRWRAAGRRVEGVIRALMALLPFVVLGAVFVSTAVWLSESTSANHVRDGVRHDDWGPLPAFVWCLGASALLLLFAIRWSDWWGARLAALQERSKVGADGSVEREWRYAPVTDPSGAAAGWAVVYGIAYLGLAVVLVWRPRGEVSVWLASTAVACLVLAVVLLVLVPAWLPRGALRRVEEREVRRALEVEAPTEIPEDLAADLQGSKRLAAAYAHDLLGRGLAYRALVRPPDDEHATPWLARRGRRINRRANLARLRTPAAAAEIPIVAPTLVLALLVGVGLVLVLSDAPAEIDSGHDRTVAAVVTLLVLAVGAGVARHGRRRLDVVLDLGADGFEYDDATLIDSPTAVAFKTTGLALLYAGAAVVASLNPYEVLPAWLAEVLVVGAIVIGVFHAVFVPSWTNRSVLAWAERQEIERARHLTPVQQAEQDDSAAFASVLVRRTVAYRAWVRIRPDGSISLTKRGERLRQSAIAARPPS